MTNTRLRIKLGKHAFYLAFWTCNVHTLNLIKHIPNLVYALKGLICQIERMKYRKTSIKRRSYKIFSSIKYLKTIILLKGTFRFALVK